MKSRPRRAGCFEPSEDASAGRLDLLDGTPYILEDDERIDRQRNVGLIRLTPGAHDPLDDFLDVERQVLPRTFVVEGQFSVFVRRTELPIHDQPNSECQVAEREEKDGVVSRRAGSDGGGKGVHLVHLFAARQFDVAENTKRLVQGCPEVFGGAFEGQIGHTQYLILDSKDRGINTSYLLLYNFSFK